MGECGKGRNRKKIRRRTKEEGKPNRSDTMKEKILKEDSGEYREI